MDPVNDLDQLVAELSASTAGGPAAAGPGLAGWLAVTAEREASDLILVAGEPPTLRIEGKLVRSSGNTLDGHDIEQLVLPELPAHAQRQFAAHGIADAAVKVPGLGRFRVNLHRERGRAAATIRRLSTKIPPFASLNLPAGSDRLARLTRGLVIIGGATGSGKTTTTSTAAKKSTSLRSKTRSSTSTPTGSRSFSTSRSARTLLTFQQRCDRLFVRRQTSSSSAKCATRRRCALRSPPARRAIWS
jgi:hypothetical protein